MIRAAILACVLITVAVMFLASRAGRLRQKNCLVAIERGDVGVVRRCVTAPVPMWDSRGYTPLTLASMGASSDVVKHLLGVGYNPNERDKMGFFPLILAVDEQNSVKALLDAGADPNQVFETSGKTALLASCTGKRSRCVEMLLKAGANVNFRSPNGGGTALMCAAAAGNKEASELLIAFGADVSATTDGGVRASEIASNSGHQELAEYLKSKEGSQK